MVITPRQKEVLDLLVQGKAVKEVAYQLGISPQTVKNHIADIKFRLKAATPIHAVVIAIKQGIIYL